MIFSVLTRTGKVPRLNPQPPRSRSRLRGGRAQSAAEGQVPRPCSAITAEEAGRPGHSWSSDSPGQPHSKGRDPQTATQTDSHCHQGEADCHLKAWSWPGGGTAPRQFPGCLSLPTGLRPGIRLLPTLHTTTTTSADLWMNGQSWSPTDSHLEEDHQWSQ